MKRIVFTAVLAGIALTLISSCATRQYTALKSGEQEIYNSRHLGVLPGPDNAISAAKAYEIVQKTDAETALIASYNQGRVANGEAEALGFIINDRGAKWNLAIKTRVGGLTIFQTDISPNTKLEYRLKYGEYVTVWSDGYQKYTDTLKVMPYADVRTMIKRSGGKEEEAKGHWLTHLPQ